MSGRGGVGVGVFVLVAYREVPTFLVLFGTNGIPISIELDRPN